MEVLAQLGEFYFSSGLACEVLIVLHLFYVHWVFSFASFCVRFSLLPLFDWTAFLLKLSWVMHFNKVCSLLHVLTVDSRRQFYFVPLHWVLELPGSWSFSLPLPLSLFLSLLCLFFSQTRWLLLVYPHDIGLEAWIIKKYGISSFSHSWLWMLLSVLPSTAVCSLTCSHCEGATGWVTRCWPWRSVV